MTSHSISSDRILATGFGFFAAKTLMTAVELNVFSLLAKRHKLSQQQLQGELGLHPRATADFLDALVALKFLQKTVITGESWYSNSEESAVYLDESSPLYVGGILIMSNRRLYRYWDDLGEALKTGRPQSEVKYQQVGLFEQIFKDPVKLKDFCAAMTGLSRQNFIKFTENYPFNRHRVHLDVGASMGLMSKLAIEKYPELQCIAFDLPEVAQITKESLNDWGVQDRVKVISGSFLTDPLPKADLITMGNILHDWNLEKKKLILQRAYDALEHGGALVVIENLIDDDRRENAFGLLMSLNMLVEFGDAFDFTFADYEGWCRDIGFTRFERMHVYGPCSAAIAYKD